MIRFKSITEPLTRDEYDALHTFWSEKVTLLIEKHNEDHLSELNSLIEEKKNDDLNELNSLV